MRVIVGMHKRPKEQTSFSRHLREHSTDAERAMWAKLRGYRLAGLKFRRQQPIGPYVVDFVCFEKKVIIEIDGGQHNMETIEQSDRERTAWLESQGFGMLRFWDNEVLTNMDGVLDVIECSAKRIPLTTVLSHKGRGG